MTNSHLTPTQLTCQLTTHYTTPLPHLSRARLLTGAHLDRLLARPDTTPQATARNRRRIMTRLHDLGLVTTLGRRIGGVRAGSAGHVYTLTTTGNRITATLTGQPCPPHVKKPAPLSTLFLAHTLAISDIYVQLITTSRDHDDVHLATFTTEPQCWWPIGHGDYLKPDAYLVLQTATHRDCWWLEIDQATESLPRIKRKCRTYLDFLNCGGLGPDGVPPRILFTVPSPQRAHAINCMIVALTSKTTADQLICVVIHESASKLLITELVTP
jgi:Replication-relaxation